MRKNHLKKALSLLVVLSLFSTMLVGCSDRGDSKTETPPPASTETSSDKPEEIKELDKLNLTIVGGSIGGAWAAIGEGVSEVIRRSYPGSTIAYEVGQEAANVAMVSTNKVQLGIAHTSFLKMASEGAEPFPKELENIRALSVLYGEAAEHFIMNQKSGIKSFEDIKDQKYPLKINLNTKDSFMEILGKKALEVNGITYEDIKSWGGNVDFMSMGSSMDLMRDGKIEAYSNVIQVPSSSVVDASSSLDLGLLSLSKEAIEKINAELGTYESVISKEKYTFLDEDVPTVAAKVVLFTNSELSDDEAYAIVKSIHENLDYFTGIHSSLKGLDIKALQDVSPVELHPGALKYYEENK